MCGEGREGKEEGSVKGVKMSDQMALVVSMERERGDSLQEQAIEGQRHLEATVDAAHDILESLNEVLCNPGLWTQPVPDIVSKPGGVPMQQEQSWLSLDAGRLRYKSTTSALRASINNIFNKPQVGWSPYCAVQHYLCDTPGCTKECKFFPFDSCLVLIIRIAISFSYCL